MGPESLRIWPEVISSVDPVTLSMYPKVAANLVGEGLEVLRKLPISPYK